MAQNNNFTPGPPNYSLSALNKTTNRSGEVGAAWINNSGHITIRLNPCVILDGNNADLVLTLFPRNNNGGGPPRSGPPRPGPARPSPYQHPDPDHESVGPKEDIPF